MTTIESPMVMSDERRLDDLAASIRSWDGGRRTCRWMSRPSSATRTAAGLPLDPVEGEAPEEPGGPGEQAAVVGDSEPEQTEAERTRGEGGPEKGPRQGEVTKRAASKRSASSTAKAAGRPRAPRKR